jgi:hypothetical protein
MVTIDRISSARLTDRATIKGTPIFVTFGTALFVKDSITGKLFAVTSGNISSYFGKVTVQK